MKNVPVVVMLPLIKSSIAMAPEHATASKLAFRSPALTIPTIAATVANNKAMINTIVGQYNSHLVYCSDSSFLQHWEGQQ